jgi:hypothetical protein
VVIAITRSELMASFPKGVRRNSDSQLFHVQATVINTSQLPIYGLRIQWHGADPYDGRDSSDALLPGEKLDSSAQADLPIDENKELLIDPDRVDAVVLFSDADGVKWRVGPKGKVDEVDEVDSPLK